MKTISWLFSFGTVCLLTCATTVSMADNEIDEILVTSTRIPLSSEKIGASISIVTEQDFIEKQIRFLTDELQHMVGVSVDQQGPRGSLSSVRLRGQSTEGTLVLIDGMEVSDPSRTQTAFDFSQLTTNAIQRVEVLRGSQSVLHGGDAVGGVVNIVTARGEGPMQGALFSEAGSYDTYSFGGNIRGGINNDTLGYNVEIQYLESNGFSAADEDLPGNSEGEEYDNLSLNGHFQYRINSNLELGLATRSAAGTMHYDAFGGPFGDDPDAGDDYDQSASRLFVDFRSTNQLISGQIGISRISNDRRGFGGDFGDSRFRGERKKADAQTNFNFTGSGILAVGIESEEESLTSTALPGGESASTNSYFALYQLSANDSLHLSLGGRIDNHQVFGNHDTYRGTLAYVFDGGGSLIRTSVSTGFRAPSLFELYGVCCGETLGNPQLEPEQSRSWDIGFRQSLLHRKLLLEFSYFRINTEREIIFCCFLESNSNPDDPNYFNIGGSTRSTGVELMGELDWGGATTMGVSYTYNRTEDNAGARLPQRPLNSLSGNLNHRFTRNLSLNLNLYHYQGMIAQTFDGTEVELDEPWLITAGLIWQYSDALSANLRIENLLDDQYQSHPGYGTSDRSVYAGLRLTF